MRSDCSARAAGPHLLAVDDVLVAVPDGAGLELGGVGAGRRLGDAEGLEAQFTRRDVRQVFLLLFIAAVTEHRAHGVHLGVAGSRVAPRSVDRLDAANEYPDAFVKALTEAGYLPP